ncbi:RHS repeat domain-containing protein [Enhygromyxa salina]|uniref:tRNA3(Ser)-specific nuclease WapA n=1 Tax=Enhygromyxa salina TaxID=215803 RepID=A0A2S9Y603_9BACT|nr:RHS repeat-associated core domain-containing protein [Enhygromyxa salina]PRQ00537.1 tRNA3(Ser)-specific nuclease WapA precursor [Enhygromyxa salina]
MTPPLGRPFLTTESLLDIQGHLLEVIDARDNTAESRTYGMLGQSLVVSSEDAGARHNLLNALGQPMRGWDSRSQRFSFSYDTLRRPVDRTVSVSSGSEKLLGRVVYGDLLGAPEDANHVGRVYRVYDGAGVATTVEINFKGNPLEEQRQLVTSKTTQPDWSALLGQSTIAAMATAATSLLDSEIFSASSERDAVNRVLTAISPDDSEVNYTYDEGGALQAVEVKHRGSSTAETVVGEITYNARGQREGVVYGSTSSPTTTTTYTYDPETYRLASLTTVRGSDDTTLQGLHYHYDPVGNITDIRDTAQQTIYFNNAVVEAANSYTYDATYRLIEATGREHSTQGTTQRTDVQITPGPQPMTSDPSAMRRYTQKFTYDEVGNILKMQHIPASGTGWTRYYEYDADGNRLDKTSAPGDPALGPYTHAYTYDAHGNMTAMPHLSSMVWNHDDELHEVTVGTESLYFQYAGGMRSRKYVEKSGTTTEERIHLGLFELYRKRINGTLDLERESLHISDDTGRICIIETKTVDGGSAVGSPTGIWRYQLSNHLGSAATEVDGSGAVISHEEYHPYGTSAYRAVNASIDVSAKRYRYTGMERDEESGLEYHSARYYIAWLGRWLNPDPSGLTDGPNRNAYVSSQPSTMRDPNGRNGAPPGVSFDEETPQRIQHDPEDRYSYYYQPSKGEAFVRNLPTDRDEFLAEVEAVTKTVNHPGILEEKYDPVNDIGGSRVKTIDSFAATNILPALRQGTSLSQDVIIAADQVLDQPGGGLIDMELAFATIAREGGLFNSRQTIDTYDDSGFDQLYIKGQELVDLGILPADFLDPKNFNKGANNGKAAEIPTERVLAFSFAMMGYARLQLEQAIAQEYYSSMSGAEALTQARADIDALDPVARRILVGFTFQMSQGGTVFDHDAKLPSPNGSGIRSLLRAFHTTGTPLSKVTDLPGGTRDALAAAGNNKDKREAAKFIGRLGTFFTFNKATKTAIAATSIERLMHH